MPSPADPSRARRGDRVKVALIYTAEDLGAIPSLFGQPGEYAQLGLWYVGPLLVVMPAGFGVYDGGRSTAAAEQVLRSVDPAGAGRTTSSAAPRLPCSVSRAPTRCAHPT